MVDRVRGTAFIFVTWALLFPASVQLCGCPVSVERHGSYSMLFTNCSGCKTAVQGTLGTVACRVTVSVNLDSITGPYVPVPVAASAVLYLYPHVRQHVGRCTGACSEAAALG